METTIAYGAGCVAGLAAFYKIARPHFTITVNCHYCDENFKVPYSKANSFICPFCDQYNGWNEDGDFNKTIDFNMESNTRFVKEQKSSAPHENGLCRSCNLNQELKIAQVARATKEGPELEEYIQHLEKVYKLCPPCDNYVEKKLKEQDISFASDLLQHKLQRSKLELSKIEKKSERNPANIFQCLLSLSIFSLFQDVQQLCLPGCIVSLLPPSFYQTVQNYFLEVKGPRAGLTIDMMMVLIVITQLAICCRKRAWYSFFIYGCLITAFFLDMPHSVQLSFAGIGAIFAIASASTSTRNIEITNDALSFPKTGTKPAVQDTSIDNSVTNGYETFSDHENESIYYQPPRTENSGVSSTISSPNINPMKSLIKSGDEFSFTHEFATQNYHDDNCDLSSLSLGDTFEDKKKTAPPFHLSRYSTSSPTNSLFEPSRPLLQPSRLTNTSWIAGGYWTPPTAIYSPSSRSSSNSSGFISGSPSVANYPSPPGSINSYDTALPRNSPLNLLSFSGNNNQPFAEIDRFSVLSEPVQHNKVNHHRFSSKIIGASETGSENWNMVRRDTLNGRVSAASMGNNSKTSFTNNSTSNKSKWAVTVTITPIGVLMAISVAINVAMFVSWIRQ